MTSSSDSSEGDDRGSSVRWNSATASYARRQRTRISVGITGNSLSRKLRNDSAIKPPNRGADVRLVAAQPTLSVPTGPPDFTIHTVVKELQGSSGLTKPASGAFEGEGRVEPVLLRELPLEPEVVEAELLGFRDDDGLVRDRDEGDVLERDVRASLPLDRFDPHLRHLRDSEAPALPHCPELDPHALHAEHLPDERRQRRRLSTRLATEDRVEGVPLCGGRPLVKVQRDVPLHPGHGTRRMDREGDVEPVQREVPEATLLDVP